MKALASYNSELSPITAIGEIQKKNVVGDMKHTFNYSDEFNEAMKHFESESSVEFTQCLFDLTDIKFQLPVLDINKIKLFNDMFRLLNSAAKVNGGTIDIMINEDDMIGKIILRGSDYCVISDDDDITRRALIFALKNADTVLITNADKNVIIDISLSFKKYLTNGDECDIM